MAIYSPFGNFDGGLLLCSFDGVPYLRMEDSTGDDYFGPLTAEQVEAFHVLCGVTESDVPKPPTKEGE